MNARKELLGMDVVLEGRFRPFRARSTCLGCSGGCWSGDGRGLIKFRVRSLLIAAEMFSSPLAYPE
jgi:hypothetical protein